MNRPPARLLPPIFGLALLVRMTLLILGPWQDEARAIGPDSTRYLILGENLGKFGAFGMVEEEKSPAWQRISRLRESNGTLPPRGKGGIRPESFRTPGYPLFLMSIRGIFPDVLAILVVQCVLGSLTACSATLVATTLDVPPKGAVVAGLLWAVHPAVVAQDCVVMTESFFCFCTASALLISSRGGLAGALLAGSLIGFAGLVRPLVGLLFIPAALTLVSRRSGRRILAAACLIGASVIPSVAWAVRNRAEGEGLRITSNSELTLLYYAASYSISEERGEDWSTTWPTRVEELADRLGRRVLRGEDVYSAARKLAIEEMRARPSAVCRVLMMSEVKLMLDHSLGDVYRLIGQPYRPSDLKSRILAGRRLSGGDLDIKAAVFAVAWMVLNAAIAAAALLGVIIAMRRRNWPLLVAGGLTCLLVVAVTATNGLERFRLPMAFPLFILAGYAIGTMGAPKRIEGVSKARARDAAFPAI